MKKVLVIGYVWPEPDSSAAGSHMLSLLLLFKAEHWQVEFASPAQESQHMVDLSLYDISSKNILLNDESFDTYIKTYQPSIVLFDRFMMEEQFGWRVEKNCPQALKILDTEDLQCLRQARHIAHKNKRTMTKSDLFSNLAKREIAAILRCDLSLIISDFEMTLLQETFHVDTRLLHYLPFMVDLDTVLPSNKTFEARQHFLTIGNFRHAPNWDMVLHLQEIWPLIRKKLPHAQLHIYGSYPPPKATALHNPKTGFLIKGWASDALAIMESSRVSLAPIRFGAGIKGKLLDAMLVQTPSVTTTLGAEGMHAKEAWPGSIAEGIEDFVEEAVRLYSDENAWKNAQKKALSLLKARYDSKVLGKTLIEKIETLFLNLTEHRLENFTGAMLRHHSMMSTKYMSQWIEAKNKK